MANGIRNPPYSNRKPPTNGPMVVPAPNMVSMIASTVDWDLESHLMASGYTEVDMADSPTAVMDLITRDSVRKTEPDLILGRNPNMMFVRPEMMQPTMNSLEKEKFVRINSKETLANLFDPILWRYFPKTGVETIWRMKAEAKTVPLLVTLRP